MSQGKKLFIKSIQGILKGNFKIRMSSHVNHQGLSRNSFNMNNFSYFKIIYNWTLYKS